MGKQGLHHGDIDVTLDREHGLVVSVPPADVMYCGECENAHVLIAPATNDMSARAAARTFARLVDHLASHAPDREVSHG